MTMFEDDGEDERWEAGVECMPGKHDRFFLMYKGLNHFKLKGPDTGDGEEGYTEAEVCERLAEFSYSTQSIVQMIEAARHRAEHLPKPETEFD